MNQRILEQEAMMSFEEVRAYDKLTLKYLTMLHNGFIETIINSSSDHGRFLEVGAGTGRISIGVAKYTENIELIGTDISDNMLMVAVNNANYEKVSDKIEYRFGDAKKLPFSDNYFDSVFCHNMLHHIPDPLVVVKEMNRVVKKDGAILIRDLIRLPKFLIPFHVNVFGLPYNELMKKEYRDSIKAALSEKEWQSLYKESGIAGNSKITKQFITHQGIERLAINRRTKYLKVPTPVFVQPFKNMYVSN